MDRAHKPEFTLLEFYQAYGARISYHGRELEEEVKKEILNLGGNSAAAEPARNSLRTCVKRN